MSALAPPRRRASGWSAQKRAKTLAAFQSRIAAREAADPTYPYKQLYTWASFALGDERTTIRMVAGRVVGLSDHHEMKRRIFVLRAWCAVKIAASDPSRESWREIARLDLERAAWHRHLARAARKEGR